MFYTGRVTASRAAALWLPVAVWCGLIFFLSSIPDLQSGLKQDFLLRKIAHMVEYAVLTALWLRAHRPTFGPRGAALCAAAFSIAYAASDELHQTFVPGRSGQWTDVAIDSVGVAAAGLADRLRR